MIERIIANILVLIALTTSMRDIPTLQPPAIPENPVVAGTALPARETPVSLPPAPVEDSWFEDAAFIGDSLTHGLSLYSKLKTPDYYHSTGSSIFGVNKTEFETSSGKKTLLADALRAGKYKKIYVLFGVNELGSDVQKYANAYSDFVDKLREYCPGATIYIQSVLPVSRAKDAKNGVFKKANVIKFNDALKKLAVEKELRYVDVYNALADSDGFLPEADTWDGVHLNSARYITWVDFLKVST